MRHHHHWLLCWIFLTFSIGLADANEVRSIPVGELTREYIEHLPTGFDKTKQTPLVLCFHGGGGNAKTMPRFTGFDTIADREGFIVVYPEGIQHHWNDGRESVTYKVDDVGFVSALIDDFIKTYNVDPKRVYATGISNGGMICQRLAIELSDKLAAVAPVAGNVPQILKDTKAGNPISILMISGTLDPIVPYADHEVKKLANGYGGKVLTVDESIQFWIKWNDCSSSPKSQPIEDSDQTDDSHAIRSEYEGKNGTKVVLYQIVGGGHTWPGARQYLPQQIIGNVCRDFNGTEVIWDFFKSHLKP